MDAKAEAADLWKLMQQRRRRTRVPSAVVERIMVHVQARRAEGATMAAIAGELGVGLDSLYRWQRRQAAVPRIVPVRVMAEAPRSRVVVHGPGGLRIEGLGLGELAHLLRALA